MKRLITYLLSLTCVINIYSQQYNVNNIQLPELERKSQRHIISVPNILGYKTLKCDFHIHTVFSDGSVWPTVRVDEAWAEGLDAIAITDHIEGQPSKKYVSGDKNASYELAKKHAEEMGITLIPSGEVTRKMPPGHLNALFLSDINMLDKEKWEDALKNTKNDGGFIIWNHPGWKAQQPDTCKWMAEHQYLFENKLMHAIEVFNEKEWYPIALDWCMQKNLAPIANSDIHGVAAYYYDYPNVLRPMTLVFAKDNSQSSIKEALFAGRTLAFFSNILAGKTEYLKAIFKESVVLRKLSKNEKGQEKYEISNLSDIPFKMEGLLNIYLKPKSTAIFTLNSNDNKMIKVENLKNSSTTCLEISLSEL